MLAEVGSILIGLALAAAVYAVFAAFWSIHRSDLRWAGSGRSGIYATATLLALALLALLVSFLGDQFQIRYVAQHSSHDLPLCGPARRDRCYCGPSSRPSSPPWWWAALQSGPDR